MSQFKPNHEHDADGYQQNMSRLLRIIDELKKETDRGVAILAAAMLDNKLTAILNSFFVKSPQADKLFKGPTAPIATLSAKMSMCFALQLIDEDEYHDAEIIRKIRNDFAHKFDTDFSFEDPSVKDRIRNFKIVDSKDEAFRNVSSRDVFVVNAIGIEYRWMFREQHAKQLRLNAPNWTSVLFPKEIVNIAKNQ